MPDSSTPGPAGVAYLETNLPCRAACPVGTNAGGYVSLVAAGRYREAYELARRPNPFASACGRICAHPCEAACRRGALDAPIQIRALKRVINEKHGVEAASFARIREIVEQPRPPAERPGRIAIIGAGPAGLACAHDLALMGHTAVVYDAAPVAGGMMRLGIPAYRLPRDVLDQEIEFVRYLGVEIRLGVEIGRDITFADLARDHDAVFLAAGCRRGRSLKIPGIDLRGVMTAVDFLANVNLGYPLEIGEDVVVLARSNRLDDERAICEDAWRRFVVDHADWIPAFCDRVATTGAVFLGEAARFAAPLVAELCDSAPVVGADRLRRT